MEYIQYTYSADTWHKKWTKYENREVTLLLVEI